tara:strand:- start:204 stop:626 length:423 start_codon:yes stop_codon:yes gene_type:complete
MKSFQYKSYLDGSYRRIWRKLLNNTKVSGRRADSMTKSRNGVMPEHNITVMDLMSQYSKQKGRCFWSGVPLRLENQDVCYHPLALSVDRLGNDKGYYRDNIVITARMINLGKNQYSSENFPAIMQEFKEGFFGKRWKFWK